MQGDLEGREGRMEELKKQCVPVICPSCSQLETDNMSLVCSVDGGQH